MFSAPPLPLSSRLDGIPMERAGGHLFENRSADRGRGFQSGSVVTPGLSLMGETN